jgi:outer membrane protein assembly factor BamB
MSDDALRGLLRAVASDGAPESRVRLAAELERLGRLDDAVAALVPASGATVARAALARLRPSVDGQSRVAADVRPAVRAPRIRWQSRLPLRHVEPGAARLLTSTLEASPLGVLASHRGGPLVALDIDSGRELWTVSHLGPRQRPRWGSDFPSISGDQILTAEDGVAVRGFALRDGELLWQLELSRGQRVAVGGGAAAGVWLVSDDGEFRSHAAPVSGPPRLEARWSIDDADAVRFVGATATRCVLSARRAGTLAAFDRRTGERLWVASGSDAVVDESGALAWRPGEVVALEPDGEPSWRRPSSVVAVTADHVIAAARDELELIDRRTGESIRSLGESDAQTVAVARDVVYTTTAGSALRAVTLEGVELWRLPIEAHGEGDLVALAPQDRGLLTISSDGTLTCSSEP